MATFELPNVAGNSTAYLDGKTPYPVNITKVTDDESDSVFNVGDTVTVTWVDDSGVEDTFSAEFIGTMRVTVSGKIHVFMVLEDTATGDTLQNVVGLNNADAPSMIVKTGNSANITAETFTVCFFPGTLIATPSGERRVEDLVPGDAVLIDDPSPVLATWTGRMAGKHRRRFGFGRAVSVKWIGRQTVSTLFGSAERLMPVRFSAGS